MHKLKQVVAALLLAVLILAWHPGRTLAASPDRLPVIFIPGIGGTELYNRNELVWVNTWRLIGSHIPGLNLLQMNWLQPLRLQADGSSPYQPSYDIRVGDVMRHNATDIYSSMISALKTQSNDVRVFPFDWRLDLAVSADKLSHYVERTLAETKSTKVILVGHSMGGLVARDYVVRGGATKVKATISLATPWLGSPMAYRALEYGWDLGMKLPGTRWSALAPGDVKTLSQNFPSVYLLGPGKAYFEQYPEGYLVRGTTRYTYDMSLNQGMAAHNRTLALRAPPYQERLLNGKDYGVEQYVLAGKGRSTLGGITERKDWLGLYRRTEWQVDGDEVVPLYSADLGYSRNSAVPARYVGKVAAVAYVENQPHTQFTQLWAVQQQVIAWLELIQDSPK